MEDSEEIQRVKIACSIIQASGLSDAEKGILEGLLSNSKILMVISLYQSQPTDQRLRGIISANPIPQSNPIPPSNAIPERAMVRPRSPPHKGAVFVLYAKQPSGDPKLIGTAVAISPHYLLTAGHVVMKQDGEEDLLLQDLHICKGVEWDAKKQNYRPSSTSIPVNIILTKRSPDIALLRRSDEGTFSCTIPICVNDQLPWVVDSDGWEAKAKLYYCPLQMGLEHHEEFINVESTEYVAIASASSRHSLKLRFQIAGGSSGGAVVLEENKKLVGIICSMTSGVLELDDCTWSSKDDDSGSFAMSASITAADIRYTYATVPGQVDITIPNTGETISLAAYVDLKEAQMISDIL